MATSFTGERQPNSRLPLSQAFGFSLEELEICVDVISIIGGNVGLLKLPAFKALRTALHPLVEARLETYGGKNALLRKKARQQKKEDAMRAAGGADAGDSSEDGAAGDDARINQTLLRAQRLKMLEDLNKPDQQQQLMLEHGLDADGVAPSASTLAIEAVAGGEKQVDEGVPEGVAALPLVPDGVATLTEQEEEAARNAPSVTVKAPIKYERSGRLDPRMAATDLCLHGCTAALARSLAPCRRVPRRVASTVRPGPLVLPSLRHRCSTMHCSP